MLTSSPTKAPSSNLMLGIIQRNICRTSIPAVKQRKPSPCPTKAWDPVTGTGGASWVRWVPVSDAGLGVLLGISR